MKPTLGTLELVSGKEKYAAHGWPGKAVALPSVTDTKASRDQVTRYVLWSSEITLACIGDYKSVKSYSRSIFPGELLHIVAEVLYAVKSILILCAVDAGI